MDQLKEHMKKIKPTIDKNKQFIFFGNHKAGLTSVNRHLLKNRVVVHKQGPQKYRKFINKLTDSRLKKMYKFTIVRNPFDRVVSAYFYLRDHGLIEQQDFLKFIKTDFLHHGVSINYHFHHQTPSAFLNGKKFVNRIVKLEFINRDWERVARKIKCRRVLPHTNRTRHNPYKSYYDKRAIEIVSKIYKDDLENFRYRFK